MIILNAVFLIRSWQDEQTRKELQAWADENDIYLRYDYPGKIKKLPGFLKEIVTKIVKKEITSLEYGSALVTWRKSRSLENSSILLEENIVLDLTPLSKMKSLDYISISGIRIQNFDALSETSNLERITLGGTYINNLNQLKSHSKLKEIFILGTSLKDISALKNLQNLEVLILMNTSVTDLSLLENLRNFKSLSLQGTRIKDITVFKRLRYLEELFLPGLTVEQLKELKIALPNCEIGTYTEDDVVVP